MPIEINELHIKINVEDAEDKKVMDTPSSKFTKEAQQQLLSECIEEVMQLLEDKKER